MRDKKTSERPTWNERLDGFDELSFQAGLGQDADPGDRAWKDVLWERLYLRLEPRRRHVAWWRLAQACLLAAAVASVFIGRRVAPRAIRTSFTAVPMTTAPLPTAPTSAGSMSAGSSNVRPLAASVPRPASTAPVFQGRTRRPGSIILSGPDLTLKAPFADSAAVVAPTLARAALSNPPAALPILHINEIGFPSDTDVSVPAGRHSWFRLPLHLLYPSVGLPDASGHTADNSAKITISLQH